MSGQHRSNRQNTARAALASGLALLLAACQTNPEPDGGPLKAEVEGRTPVNVLQKVNEQALACWVKSGDKDFKPFTLVPELDTQGSPRILVVERGKAEGLPKLVIQASGKPVRIQTFGPLASSELSARINSDVVSWAAGRKGCA